MRRTRVLAGGALAAIAAAGALVVAWDRGAGDVPPASSEDSSPIEARATLSPRITLFGDTVLARVDVLLDRARVDPESVRVAAEFSPWEAVGEPERVRTDAGSATHVRTTFVIRCLRSPCIPSGQAAPLEFDPVRVSFTGTGEDGAARDTVRVGWPVLVVYSRFASANFEGRGTASTPWRADLVTLPAVSYRVAPGLALAFLLAATALLAVVGIALVYVARPRRAPPPPPALEPEPEPALTPLEQALALLEDPVRADGAADQRRALELVAEELDGRNSDLARTARVLAWSEEVPEVAETSGLAARVRMTLEEERDGRVL